MVTCAAAFPAIKWAGWGIEWKGDIAMKVET
jgi:hypothetical protein